jgi:hypothetical protein
MRSFMHIDATKVALCLCFMMSGYRAHLQNVSSPYSILGIGDIETRDFGRYAASGSSAISRRDVFTYNFSNPASLTSLQYKTMFLDVAMRGRTSRFMMPDEDTVSMPSRDFTIKRISMAFKIGSKTGIAFGMRPYSSVNYRLIENISLLDNTLDYVKLIDGSGGINQFYFSAGRNITRNLSAGVTASWLTGSLKRTTNYLGRQSNLRLNIVRDEKDFYWGGLFQGGLQYNTKQGKKWQHLFGLTGSVSTNLHGELTVDYLEEQQVLESSIERNRKITLPLTAAFGYTALIKKRLALSMETQYQYWTGARLDYPNSRTGSALRQSFGLDYTFQKTEGLYTYEKGYLGFGFSGERNYMRIRGNELWDYSVTFGGGINFNRFLSFTAGLEIGRKGNLNIGQIRETYTQFAIGITFRDTWINRWKYGRYD